MELIKNKTLRAVKTTAMNRLPRTYMLGTRLLARHLLFRAERNHLSGVDTSASDLPSVLLFAYNRTGSMYIAELIEQIVRPDGLRPINLGSYLFHAYPDRANSVFENEDFINRTLRPTGFFYGPLRFIGPYRHLDAVRVVLVLRDPRDVLTSRFYSVAYSHSPADRAFLEARNRARKIGIDRFVDERKEEVRARYRFFIEHLLGRPNVAYLPYEEMVTDFSTWIWKLARHVSPSPRSAVLDALIAKSDFSVSREDKFAHKRSVQPGNHAKKLQPETVAMLNAYFADEMKVLGYTHAEHPAP